MRCLYLLCITAVLLSTATLSAQCPITVNAGDDIWLCSPPSPTQLDGSISGDYLNFTWSPLVGLQGANTLNPNVTVTGNATYVLTARAVDLSNNLITNGDFEGGNSGFSSDYVFSPGNLVPEGVYNIVDNPQNDHPGFAPCPDHTSGSGNMMAVNGAGSPNQNVWCQTVNVQPNTLYAFSAWVTTLVAASPALLQFSINGGVIGPIFNAPSGTCNWVNFYTTWNSGANSTATICIVNQNTVLGGNDFALDDIVFSPVCVETDTVQLFVVNVQAAASPAVSLIPCDGANITLSGLGSSVGPNIFYQWDTPDGNIVSGGTTLNPVVNSPGTYTLTVTFNNGFVECTKTATVNVILNPNQLFTWINPPLPLGCGNSTVQLLGFSSQPGFSTYQWTSDPGGNFTSGTTGSTATVDAPGEYTLLVTNTTTGCTAEASVTVIAATDPPTANATAGISVFNCASTTFSLSGAGSSQGNNIAYAWTAQNGGNIIAGANTQNANADTSGTYILTVTNTSNGCTAADTVLVTPNLTPPVVAIDTPGIFNCATDTLTLLGNVNVNTAQTTWLTASGGSFSGDSSLLQITALTPGVYILTALDTANFCFGSDTVVVNIDTVAPLVQIAPPGMITCQNPSISLSGAGSSQGAGIGYLWTASAGGNVVSGETTLDPVVNAAGAYTLRVTNTANGCTADSTVFVTADADAIVAVANAPDTLTCTVLSVLLNANGSSNIPGLTYAWTTTNGLLLSGADTPTPTAGLPGTYFLLLTNPANGCTATDQAIVAQNITPPNLGIAAPDTLTCANPTLSLQGQNNGPAGSFTFLWTASNGGNILSGETTLSPTVNAAGTYTLSAINLINGCTATVSAQVAIEAGTPVALATVPGPITCTDPTQTLSTAGSSFGPNFTYNWVAGGGGNILSGQNGPAPVVDAPGNYALTITNTANGCTATTTVSVAEDTAAPPADAGPDGLLTCTDPVFSLSANGGQSNSLQFIWQTSNGGFSGNPNNADVNTTLPGTYNLTVTNPQNGCTATDTAIVTADQTPPDVSILAPALLTCVQLTATLNTTGGAPNFGFQWTTPDGQFVSGQNSPTPVVDAPGQYDLLVTNTDNGCTTVLSSTVNQNIAIPQAAISPAPTLTCTLLQTTLQGAVEPGPGINIAWTASGGGNILSGGDTPNPIVDQPGNYLLLVTNTANGCTNTASISVLQNILSPAANAGQQATLSCLINSLTLSGSGSANGTAAFSWSAAGGGNIVSGAGTPTPTVNAPGQYTLLVTDLDNGCTSSSTVLVQNDANAPTAAVGQPGTLTCAVAQLTLPGSGSTGANFVPAWTAGSGGNIVSGGNGLSPVVNAPGVYTLTVTNTQNGCTATAQSTVLQNITPPPVSIAAPGTLTCATQTLALSGTPTGAGFTYLWQTTGGNIVSGGTTPAPTVNQPGTYTLQMTDLANGCTATASTQVSSNTVVPAIAAAAPQTLTCAVAQVPLSGTVSQPANGFSVGWTTQNGQIVSGQNTLAPIVSAPGAYLLTVQNQQNGCTATATATVLQNITPPVANAGPAPTLTCTQPQAALSAAGSSGQGTLAYSWAGGQIVNGGNTPAPTISQAATYTVTVTDGANGCTASASVTALSNTTPPVAVIAQPLPRTCVRDTVTLNASASSSGPNFSINWTTTNGHFTGGQTTLTPQANAAGTYILLLTNTQNGCTTTASTTVTEDLAAPNAEAGPAQELYCDQPQATLSGSSSTAGTMSFSWTAAPGGNIVGGGNSAGPVVNAPGAYLLTVTNPANGCTATDNVLVTEIPLPTFVPQPTQPNCHIQTGAIAFGAVAGGEAPFRYSINGGQSFQVSPNFSNLQPGPYDLVVSDALGCTAIQPLAISPPFLPTVTLSVGPILELGDSLQLQPILNLPANQVADWIWTPADGLSCTDCPMPWARPFRPTVYRLRILDLDGCPAEASVLVQVNRRRNLYAPNIFSPDGDGLNDRFLLYGRGVTIVRSLRIFDRWGNQLFLNENLPINEESAGWDGTFRGQQMQPGVYVWQAEVEFVDGAVEVFAGDVTVYR